MSTAEMLFGVLAGRVEGRLERDVGLAGYTTYKLGGPAALFFEPATQSDLGALTDAVAGLGIGLGDLDVLVIGRGSNLVVSDRGWPGLVVHLGRSFGSIEAWSPPDAAEPQTTGARVGGVVAMPQLANWTVRRGLAGFEWAVGVPGSVGGGVRMNAGAHGVEVGDHLVSVEVWDLFDGSSRRPAVALDLSYRHSNLGDHEVVTSASFAFDRADPEQLKARAEAHRAHRAATQPGALQNAGSVFKNPPGDFAGRLVEAAGLKGFTRGSARVSDLHANFFIAPPGTSAQDVYELVRAVRAKVAEHSGVNLEPEIRFVGSFESRAASSGGR